MRRCVAGPSSEVAHQADAQAAERAPARLVGSAETRRLPILRRSCRTRAQEICQIPIDHPVMSCCSCTDLICPWHGRCLPSRRRKLRAGHPIERERCEAAGGDRDLRDRNRRGEAIAGDPALRRGGSGARGGGLAPATRRVRLLADPIRDGVSSFLPSGRDRRAAATVPAVAAALSAALLAKSPRAR